MLDFRQSLIRSMLHKVLKRLHYPLEVMLTWVRWYVSCPLSLRHIDAGTRCICRPHHSASLGIKVLPVLAAVFPMRKRQVGRSWRLDETYIKVAGQWKYRYRAVDKFGDTVDFFAHRQARLGCSPTISRAGHHPTRRAREDHHRQERCQYGRH
jgi:putative transposase